MSINTQPVIVTEEDFNLLKRYMSPMPDKQSDMSLAHELHRAVVVKNDAFPPHCIRLNSKVSVLDLETDRVLEFSIVLPEYADMRTGKVSVLTPMGAALIGFRKAEELQCRVPAGLKRFRILDVYNRAQA